jgi:hypothetical protein
MLRPFMAATMKKAHPTHPKPSSAAPERVKAPPRSTLFNAIDADLSTPRSRPTKPSTLPKPSSHPSYTLPTTPIPPEEQLVSLESAESSTVILDTLKTDEARAARLRHFQRPVASPPTISTTTTLDRLNATPTRAAALAFHVSAGADCIDLTDD